MRHARAKAVGLGFALLAGHAPAQDAPRPATPPPAAVRGEWVPSGMAEAEPVWLPARRPGGAAAPAVVPAGGRPTVEPVTTPAPGPLPYIPVIPNVMPKGDPAPPAPAPRPRADALPPPRKTAPMGSDDPVTPPKPLPKPAPTPADPPPAPLRTYTPPEAAEWPVAPAELMVPAGAVVPGKHGSWGSPPVSLSRDYPPLRELVHGGGWLRDPDRPHLFGGLFGDDTPGEPAIDQVYLRLEYLLWFVNPQRIPALATTAPDGGLGFLGQPGTQTLLGPGEFGDTLRNGFRVRGGYWFQDCGSCGIDGSFFFLGRTTERRSFDGNTFPTITRPFFAPNFNAEFGEIVSFPGFARGRLDVEANSSLWGFDANLRHALCKRCDFRHEVFAGYRFLGLNEDLRITENITSLPGNPDDPPGTLITVQDEFRTRNRFNGGQVGYAAERNWGRLSLDGRASVALGNTRQELDITGSQVRQRPGQAPERFVGGLLATGPNLGHFERDRFSVVPELGVNLGYWLTPTFKAYVGYNFMYWSNVIRPGDQIDRVVDVSLVPNPPAGAPFSGQLRPRPTFKEDDLFIHGLQFGVEWRW